MKNALLCIVLAASLIFKVSGQSVDFENRNYSRANTVLVPGVTTWSAADQLPVGQKFQLTEYIDGLGRPLQTVSKQTALLLNGQIADNVKLHYFDGLGREATNYMPFVSSDNIGKYKSDMPLGAQLSYIYNKYPGEDLYGTGEFSTEYEASPLNRVKKTFRPGASWVGAGRPTATFDYDYNNANEAIRKWTYTSAGLFTQGSYLPNTLNKITTSDEKGGKSVIYKDFQGKTILVKVQDKDTSNGLDVNGHAGWLCTYYVYDDFDRLNFVITPKLVSWLAGKYGSNADWVADAGTIRELCYNYQYDDRARLTVLHKPGEGNIEFVYDRKGRLVFSRTEGDKAKQRWLVTLYDNLDRIKVTGFLRNCTYDRNYLADLLENQPAGSNTINVSVTGDNYAIDNLVLPQRNPSDGNYIATQGIQFLPGFVSENNASFFAEIRPAPLPENQQVLISDNPVPTGADLVALIVNYYDDYTYAHAKSFRDNYSFPSDNNTNALPTIPTKRSTDFITGQKIRVIDDENYDNDGFLLTSSYYDEKANPIQTITENYLRGINIATQQFDFSGKLLNSCVRETVPGTSIQNFPVITSNRYDQLGRLSSVYKSYNGQTAKKIVSFTYDEAGQLVKKQLAPDYNNGQGLETLEYSHNIQGWVSGINKNFVQQTSNSEQWQHYFGELLGYDNADAQFVKPQYNGDVAGLAWRTQGDNTIRRYDYDYTKPGALKSAFYLQRDFPSAQNWNASKFDFSATQMQYDENGNLLSIQQKGVIPGRSTPVVIDQLNYEYDKNGLSNRLARVTDIATTGELNGKTGDFVNAQYLPDQHYIYNVDGSLVKDYNKGIQNDAAGFEGIEYNVLGKPFKITIPGKRILKYVYDASGTLLARRAINTAISQDTSKWEYYINDLVLEGSVPQYFVNETGRLRISKTTSWSNSPAPALIIGGNNGLEIDNRPAFFDYYISDYQDNVRMVLTEEEHTEYHLATGEISDDRQKNYEESMFGQPGGANELVNSRVDIPPAWSSHYNDAANKKAVKLNQGNPVGPNALFKVMGGDELNVRAEYFFAETPSSSSSIAAQIATSLMSTIGSSGVVSTGTHGFATQIKDQLVNAGDFLNYVQNPDHSSTNVSLPAAYINWLFFDENFNPVPFDSATGSGSGAIRVIQPGDGQSIIIGSIRAPRNGYAFVYLSNSSNINVWFDNFAITHKRGRILQENHYYPYGLQIAAISSKSFGKLDNRYRFQGAYSDWEEETGWNNFDLRSYDAQIGRWISTDPYGQFPSPYEGLGNNPVNNIDVDGGWVDQVLENVTVRSSIMNNAVKEAFNSLGNAFFDWYRDANGRIKFDNDRHGWLDAKPGEQYLGVGGSDSYWGHYYLDEATQTTYLEDYTATSTYIDKAKRSAVIKAYNEHKLYNEGFANGWVKATAIAAVGWNNAHSVRVGGNRQIITDGFYSYQTGQIVAHTTAVEVVDGPETFLAAGLYGLGRKGLIWAAEEMAAKGGEDLAFGLRSNLNEFSEATGFKNYRQFTSGGFKPNEIQAAIENPANNLHFNLTDFSRYRYLKFDPTAPLSHGNITNWELHTIYNTPGALQRTTFYKFLNGSYQTVPKPF